MFQWFVHLWDKCRGFSVAFHSDLIAGNEQYCDRPASRYLARNLKPSLDKRASWLCLPHIFAETLGPLCKTKWVILLISMCKWPTIWEGYLQAYKLKWKIYRLPSSLTYQFFIFFRFSDTFIHMKSSYRPLKTIFLFIMLSSSFNFPKIYFEMFDIKSKICYKIVIRISHSNLHVIVNTKTFQSKQISSQSRFPLAK